MPFHLRSTRPILQFSLPALLATMTTNSSPTNPTIPYTPRHSSFPYSAADFRRSDPSPDSSFYDSPRFVTHIDDAAIARLRTYYLHNLPPKGRILDLCSSWISHFPPALEEAAINTAARDAGPSRAKSSVVTANEGGLEVVGLGMNATELSANPILSSFICQDLNVTPMLPTHLAPLDATTCVVSIDYLTQPVAVLTSLLSLTKEGGTVNLVVSNRCFPTKAIGRWLRVGEQERLHMVGDFLWWAGWREVEILTLEGDEGTGGKGAGVMAWFGTRTEDPLWVVRARKASGSGTTSEGDTKAS